MPRRGRETCVSRMGGGAVLGFGRDATVLGVDFHAHGRMMPTRLNLAPSKCEQPMISIRFFQTIYRVLD